MSAGGDVPTAGIGVIGGSGFHELPADAEEVRVDTPYGPPSDVLMPGTVEAPRFSTRAESRWFAAAGWSLVDTTGHPEAVLARELAPGHAAVAHVTDLDAGVDAAESVAQEEVFRVFAENTGCLRRVVLDAVGRLPESDASPPSHALDGMNLPLYQP
ncbi:hypothetical protein ACE14D_01715 [Streptomyces sp. Act-28]